jgi:1-phosphofructokinase family hexose kinase
VTAVGIVAGRSGDWIDEQLAELGIDRRLARSNGETRTCVSVLDRVTGGLTEFYERGPAVDLAAWDDLERMVADELGHGDVAAVALSGNLPPGAPPDGFGRIARIARGVATPVPVLADTYGPALEAALAEQPTIVKINAAEAGDATGVPVSDPVSAATAAAVLLEAGAVWVVVTLGLAGAVVASGGGRTWLVPPAIHGAYPVGSGDAFLGGVAVAYERGESVVQSARLGLAAGIANAQVPGAGVLDPTSIDRIVDQIGVASI